MKKRWVGRLTALLLMLGANAVQAQSCSVINITDLDVNFGTYTGATLNISSPGTLKILCTGTNTAKRLYVCVGLAAGSGSTSVNDRKLKNGTSSLSYQLYRDSGHSNVFGEVDAGANIQYNGMIPSYSVVEHDTGITLYGQVLGGQTPAATGLHQSTFSAADISVKWRVTDVMQALATCSQLDLSMAPGSFSVKAQVQPACSVTVQLHVYLGIIAAPPGGLQTGTGRFRVRCQNEKTYNVEIGDGLYAINSGSATAKRYMRSTQAPFQLMAYELYQDAARTQRWGRIANGQHLTETASNKTHYVYASSAVPSTAKPGKYEDTVTVVVEY